MTPPAVSVVVPSHNEGDNVVDTVRYVLENASGEAVDVVVVDDGSTDGSGARVEAEFGATGRVRVVRGSGLGVAAARNRGAAAAGGAVLVFLDAHCYLPPGALSRLVAPLEDPAAGLVTPGLASLATPGPRGYGLRFSGAALETDWLARQAPAPYPVPLASGCCQALRRADFERLGGYDAGMGRWGSEDLEMSLRVWLMGLDVLVAPDSLVYHLFRSQPYALDLAEVLHNVLRMAVLHLSTDRFARVVDAYRHWPVFARSVALLLDSDVMALRRRWEEVRRRDDDAYCERFGLDL